MDLLILRDRIRETAKKACLTYTEIETIADVNELSNQVMPCLMWNYTGESTEMASSANEMVLDFYFLGNMFDSAKVESGLYERDYIVTEKNKIRKLFKDFIGKLSFESANNFLEIIRVSEIPMAERQGIEGFITLYVRITVQTNRDYCLDVEQIEDDEC